MAINKVHGTAILTATDEADYAAITGRRILSQDDMIETDRNRPAKN